MCRNSITDDDKCVVKRDNNMSVRLKERKKECCKKCCKKMFAKGARSNAFPKSLFSYAIHYIRVVANMLFIKGVKTGECFYQNFKCAVFEYPFMYTFHYPM